MKESFLHFIWKFQHFRRKQLQTTEGMIIRVLKVGVYNNHSGPDFKQASIQIDAVEWVGNVEMHLKSSDWYAHRHQKDSNYNSVILHVVWKNDRRVLREDGTELPTLALANYIAADLLERYQLLATSNQPIACTPLITNLERMPRLQMFDTALKQRLKRKAKVLLAHLDTTTNDWETVSFWHIATCFGFNMDSQQMLKMAQSFPFKVIQIVADQCFHVEAIMFGTAGFLETVPQDVYQEKLQKEFLFLSKKYNIKVTTMPAKQWNFMRLRPSNFPTTRIAQLAATIHHFPKIFSKLMHHESLDELYSLFNQPISSYWQQHYDFGKKRKTPLKHMGKQNANRLLINVIPTILMAYGLYKKDLSYQKKAFHFLEMQKSEKNNITDLWASLALPITNAFESQATLEIYKNYCLPKKCLQCQIGISLVQQNKG